MVTLLNTAYSEFLSRQLIKVAYGHYYRLGDLNATVYVMRVYRSSSTRKTRSAFGSDFTRFRAILELLAAVCLRL